MSTGKLRVAVVGLGFGRDFVPIYKHHPDVEEVVAFDLNRELQQEICAKNGVSGRFESFEQIVTSREIDAVHLLTPIPLHATQVLALLHSGKHCACAVPMATSIEELRALIAAQRETQKNYMMMETAVYTREFFYASELVRSGALGRIQFLRGAHCQDLEGLNSYWWGLPPMHYATHAVGPLLELAQTQATTVHCFGSGTMRQSLQKTYGNPYPAETAIFRLAGTQAAAEVTRTLFDVAIGNTESFNVYGDKMGFEWQQVLHGLEPLPVGDDEPRAGRKRKITRDLVRVPDYGHLLPAEIAHFTENGGHHGSHPHLAHEFISSIVQGRPPAIDAVKAAQWTAPGICAHASAMQGGAAVEVPGFD